MICAFCGAVSTEKCHRRECHLQVATDYLEEMGYPAVNPEVLAAQIAHLSAENSKLRAALDEIGRRAEFLGYHAITALVRHHLDEISRNR